MVQIKLKTARVIHDASLELISRFITNIGNILEDTTSERSNLIEQLYTTRRLQCKLYIKQKMINTTTTPEVNKEGETK